MYLKMHSVSILLELLSILIWRLGSNVNSKVLNLLHLQYNRSKLSLISFKGSTSSKVECKDHFTFGNEMLEILVSQRFESGQFKVVTGSGVSMLLGQ
jgi:hypothetical protein